MKQFTFSTLFFIIITLTAFNESASAQHDGEILATVNGEVITREDIDFVLATDPSLQRMELSLADVLRQLVSNLILSQTYLEEYHPTIDQIETLSRAQIVSGLARLQIQEISESIQKSVSPDDRRIQIIIEDNATAFEERKLIIFIESDEIEAPEEFWTSASRLKELDDVTTLARQDKIDINFKIVSIYTEEIPASFRDFLLDAKTDEVIIAREPESQLGRLFMVKHVYDAAITGEEAETAARDILVEALQRQAIDNFLKDKTASSIITYSESLSRLEELPVGTTEEAVQARRVQFFYFVASLSFLSALGSFTHVMITRCWTGRFYVPFSAWFSDRARRVKLKLDTGDLTIGVLERSLRGGGKAAAFLAASIGWIFYIVLVSMAAREDYRLVLPTALVSIVVGLGLTALVATPVFLKATSKRRVLVMNVSMSIFIIGAVMVAYYYYRYIGFV